MARTSRQSHLSPAGLKAMRQQLGRNQRDFWSMFGVSQPLGSRFEKDTSHPLFRWRCWSGYERTINCRITIWPMHWRRWVYTHLRLMPIG